MSLIGCVGTRLSDAVVSAIAEAIKDDCPQRLEAILVTNVVVGDEINRKNLLHQAAWLGYPGCVRVLLNHGANPDWPHRKNGCTPLHLAHLRTIEVTNAEATIQELIKSGANVNSRGGRKCDQVALDHFIQHQRFDSVQSLVKAKPIITLQSVVIAIDVANLDMLELLLDSGGDCGNLLEATLFWGRALHRAMYTPLKCPKEWYKSMFKLLTEATVCLPIMHFLPHNNGGSGNAGGNNSSLPAKKVTTKEKGGLKMTSKKHLMIENELKLVAKDYVDLAQYLYVFLIRNGYYPNEAVKTYVASLGMIDWIDGYLANTNSLKDLSVRVLRTYLNQSGNILYGIKELGLPNRMRELVLCRSAVDVILD